MEEVIITRRSVEGWTYTVDGLLGAEDAYTGSIVTGTDLLTIKSLNGSPQVINVPYTVISYVDNTDATRNRASFDSVIEAFFYLLGEGFYVGSATSGGGGGATVLFKNLPDVNVPTFLGRDGQFVVVNGSFLETIENPATNIRIQDLSNWAGGEILYPNMAIITGETFALPSGQPELVQAPLINLINRPARYNEPQAIQKGYIYDGTVKTYNLEDYAPQVGDIFQLLAYDEESDRDYYYPQARYMGGSLLDPDSYTWHDRYFLPFPTDPVQ